MRRNQQLAWVITAVAVLAALVVVLSEQETPQDTHTGVELVERPQLTLPAPVERRPGYEPVRRVIDGDTLEMASGTRVRLIGIDCPEVGRSEVDLNSPGWQASEFVHELLQADPQVRLELGEEPKDRYGRTLAYAWLPNGEMLNENIARQGWADVMTLAPNNTHAALFREARNQARKANKGMWR